jgi:hypothetical protein
MSQGLTPHRELNSPRRPDPIQLFTELAGPPTPGALRPFGSQAFKILGADLPPANNHTFFVAETPGGVQQKICGT